MNISKPILIKTIIDLFKQAVLVAAVVAIGVWNPYAMLAVLFAVWAVLYYQMNAFDARIKADTERWTAELDTILDGQDSTELL